MLSPATDGFEPSKLERSFTIRAKEAFLTTFGVAIVPDFVDTLAMARGSGLIALVSRSCFDDSDATARALVAFDLPVPTPELPIEAMWHPRLDADPAHRWL